MRCIPRILILLGLIYCSCNENSPRSKIQLDKLKQDSITIVETNRRTRDSIVGDKEKRTFLRNAGEKDIRFTNVETYRYLYGSFMRPLFIFTLTVDSQNNGTLSTKCVAYMREGSTDSTQIFLYNDKHYTISKDTVIGHTVQLLSNKELDSFSKIIRGSYYWALSDPWPDGSGYTDGDGLGLETLTRHRSHDTLSYHMVSIHVPFSGSFKDGCKFLASISDLTKKDKSIHEDLNQR